MQPIDFKERTVILAEDQPQYLPLPVFEHDGEMISCWKLTILERLIVLFTGRLWLRQLTFGCLMQPQKPEVRNPFRKKP